MDIVSPTIVASTVTNKHSHSAL